jgi:hypothetical protein
MIDTRRWSSFAPRGSSEVRGLDGEVLRSLLAAAAAVLVVVLSCCGSGCWCSCARLGGVGEVHSHLMQRFIGVGGCVWLSHLIVYLTTRCGRVCYLPGCTPKQSLKITHPKKPSPRERGVLFSMGTHTLLGDPIFSGAPLGLF